MSLLNFRTWCDLFSIFLSRFFLANDRQVEIIEPDDEVYAKQRRRLHCVHVEIVHLMFFFKSKMSTGYLVVWTEIALWREREETIVVLNKNKS